MPRRFAPANLALVFMVGCSGNGMPPLAAVRGTVKLPDGRPVNYATVVFTPDSASGTQGPVASASLDASGRYTLRTASQYSGATVGRHVVTVEAEYQPDVPASQRAPIPGRYGARKTSPLTAEVVAGTDNVIDFVLAP